MGNYKDTKLIKDFKKSDVFRLRNLISKNYDDSTKVQVGFDRDDTIHKENDVWEESGKTWTIRNGIKRNVTQFEGLKKLTSIPSFCPKCNKFMNHDMDKKMFVFHAQCMDCYVSFETELKRLGIFEEYEKNQIKNNVLAYISDLESKFNEYLNETLTFMSEQGDSEGWQGDVNKEQIVKEFNDYISTIKSQFDIV